MEAIRYYIEHRDESLFELQRQYRYCDARLPRSKAHAKEAYLRVLNGGALSSWAHDRGLERSRTQKSEPSHNISDFATEARLRNAIISQARPDLIALFTRIKRRSPSLCAVSYAICEVEDAMIQLIEQSLDYRDIHVVALTFDGVIASSCDAKTLQATLREAEENIWDQLQFRINLVAKPWSATVTK